MGIWATVDIYCFRQVRHEISEVPCRFTGVYWFYLRVRGFTHDNFHVSPQLHGTPTGTLFLWVPYRFRTLGGFMQKQTSDAHSNTFTYLISLIFDWISYREYTWIYSIGDIVEKAWECIGDTMGIYPAVSLNKKLATKSPVSPWSFGSLGEASN